MQHESWMQRKQQQAVAVGKSSRYDSPEWYAGLFLSLCADVPRVPSQKTLMTKSGRPYPTPSREPYDVCMGGVRGAWSHSKRTLPAKTPVQTHLEPLTGCGQGRFKTQGLKLLRDASLSRYSRTAMASCSKNVSPRETRRGRIGQPYMKRARSLILDHECCPVRHKRQR